MGDQFIASTWTKMLSFTILGLALVATAYASGGCYIGTECFKSSPNTYTWGGKKFEGVKGLSACKSKCLSTKDCKAFDFDENQECWYHTKDVTGSPRGGVTQYTKIPCQTNCHCKGHTFPVGSTKVINCVTYKCWLDGNTFRLDYIKLACQIGDGIEGCIDAGATYQKTCRERTCNVVGNRISWHEKPTGCMGTDNKCYSKGDTFPCSISGVSYDKCTCVL